MRAFAISFVILVHCCFVHAEQTSGKVIIEYQANAVQLLSKSFLFYPVNKNLSYDTANLKAVNGWVRWEKIGTDYYLVRIPVFSSLPVMPLVEPGDHVRINMHNDIPVFSGKGSEKFQLIYTLERINEKLDKDLRYRKKSYHQDSVTTDDYQLWNHFLDGKKKVMVKLIESFKGKLSLIAYDYIKAAILTSIEEKRMEKFIALRGNYHGLTPAGLCTLYDSTLGNTEAIWLQSKAQLITTSTYYLMWIVRLEAMFRNYGCDESKVPDSLKDDTKRYVMYYRYAKKRFTGKIREELLAYMFSDHDRIIGSLGFIPETEAMLKDYYKLPGFPEYRKYVKERETAFRDAYARSKPLPFTLTDANDKAFSNDQLKGKTTIIDFWYT